MRLMMLNIVILVLTVANCVNSYGLLGGFSEVPLDSLTAEDNSPYLDAAKKAIELMNGVIGEDGASSTLSLQKLISLKTQVIAGINYKMTMEVLIDGKSETCRLLVTNRVDNRVPGGVWSVAAQSVTDPCAPFAPVNPEIHVQRQKRSLLGGEYEANVEDEGVKAAVQWSLEHINSMSNSLYRQVMVGASDVTKQLVNGWRYRFRLTTASSKCRNSPENVNKGLEQCEVGNDAKLQDCDVIVIFSLGEYKMDKWSCQPSNQKTPILGKDLHDFLPHGRPYYGLPPRRNSHERRSISSKSGVTHMLIGGDDHDYLPHQSGKCTQYRKQFEAFKTKHNKLYTSNQDEANRFMIFCENMEKVKEYQAQERGSAVYGATQFADISEAEFKKQYLGLKPSSSAHSSIWPSANIPNGPIPDSWDWRDHGAVTPVKNQGGCGSCWAFSTTGNIEGQWALINKKLFSLSEQELVDCDKIDEGCNGGLPSQAYTAIMKLGGLETEKDYKYDGHDEKCTFNKSKVVVTLSGAVNISQDETEMAAWLYKNGPISIGINSFMMQFYFGGIAHPWKLFCNPKDLDHGVLIVGYGVEKGEPYWIVKNSWGPSWGREGYYYVYRGDGTCGLNTMCTSAQVEKQ